MADVDKRKVKFNMEPEYVVSSIRFVLLRGVTAKQLTVVHAG